MNNEATTGPIDGYLAAMRSRLRGPARYKASLLAEARDGLDDAAEAYRARGWDEHHAQRQAVADFGDLREVLPAFQAELSVAQSRRIAILLAVGCPLLQVSSTITWRFLFPSGNWAPSRWYLLLAQAVDIGTYVIAFAAVIALVGMGYGARYVSGVRVAQIVASGAMAGVAAISTGGAVLTLYSPMGFSSFIQLTWPVAIQSLVTYALFSYVFAAAVRCLAIMPARVERQLVSC